METVLLSSHIWQTVYQEAPETAPLQLHGQPGCCLWDAPWQPPVPFSFHWSNQASEPDLPHASWEAPWTQALPLLIFCRNYTLQPHFPHPFLPALLLPCSVQGPVKQLRDQQDKPGWVLPYREAQGRSSRLGVGLYVNWVKPSVHQLYC